MKMPFFLIYEDKLKENIDAFKSALNEIWPNSALGYSVKTNSLPWLLEYLEKQHVMAEVVSDEEYRLAKACGYSDNNIIFNGPIKGKDLLASALKNGAYVNIDSKSDLEVIKTERPEGSCIGVRVNVDASLFDENDIGYKEEGFRFGYSEKNGEFFDAIKIIMKSSENTKLGLHLHCNSITRSINVYKMIAKFAAGLIKKYHLDLSYIDMGGGFFGGIEGKPTAKEYISYIKKEFEEIVDFEKTKLILEPGSAIIGSVVDLHTEVLDIKDTDYSRIVTTNGSRIHIDPLWIKSKYMYSIKQKINKEPIDKQIICGYTCMDHDRLMVLENESELSIGDEIIYHRVGAYSMTFGGMFIAYYPEVYVENENQRIKVRSCCDVDTYVKLHT